MQAPQRIETTRLVLRKPTLADADSIFSRYAGDSLVTRYIGWPRHKTVEQTRAFLTFSDAEWSRWPAAPYLIECLKDGHRLAGPQRQGFYLDSRQEAQRQHRILEERRGRPRLPHQVEPSHPLHRAAAGFNDPAAFLARASRAARGAQGNGLPQPVCITRPSLGLPANGILLRVHECCRSG